MTGDVVFSPADQARAKPTWRWVTSDQPRFDVSSITIDGAAPASPQPDPFREPLLVAPPEGGAPRKIRISGRFREGLDLMTVHAFCRPCKWTIGVSISGHAGESSLSFSAGGAEVATKAIELS